MDHGNMDGDAGNMEGMGPGMMMYFHVGTVSTILFDFWKTNEIGGFLGSLVLIFFMGVAYEALKFFRDYIQVDHKRRISRYNSMADPGEHGSSPAPIRAPLPAKHGMLTKMHAIQSVLHFIQFVLSYFLMLIFMTYNVWICLAVSLGVTVGYFFFGWQRGSGSVQDSNECCH